MPVHDETSHYGYCDLDIGLKHLNYTHGVGLPYQLNGSELDVASIHSNHVLLHKLCVNHLQEKKISQQLTTL